jgi:hypothetical protein
MDIYSNKGTLFCPVRQIHLSSEQTPNNQWCLNNRKMYTKKEKYGNQKRKQMQAKKLPKPS